MNARIVDGRKIARVTDDGKLKVLVHGRDGDDLVPVKVSEDGYLMLATDVTVEGVTVDLDTVELNQGAPGQNPWPVTLSGKKASLRYVNASSSAVVEAGKTENIDITPTAGHIGRLRGLAISQGAPTGATKNTHYCNILVGSLSLGQIAAGYDKRLAFSYSEPETGINTRPTDSLAFTIMLYNIVFSTANPLRLSYVNNTDADQTTTRYIYALIEEEAIV